MRNIYTTTGRFLVTLSAFLVTLTIVVTFGITEKASAASLTQKEQLAQTLANQPITPHPLKLNSEGIDLNKGLQPAPKQSRMSTFSLQERTYTQPLTTSSKSPIIYGSVPSYCSDVGILLFPDTANIETGEGIYAFFSESNQIYLETDYGSEYQGVWYLDLNQNGLGLINGHYNIYVSSKCGFSSYDSPLYADIYFDSLLIMPSACDQSCAPVYRFYNTQNGAHFYTTSGNEKRNVFDMKQYRYEGIVNFAKTTSQNGLMPIHRFYNKINGTHFYTSSQGEATSVNNNQWKTYRYEGIAYYGYYANFLDAAPVHRFYKFKQGVHFYTSNQNEATVINNNQWHTYRYEGISYYGIANIQY